jgi:hypothetical protein
LQLTYDEKAAYDMRHVQVQGFHFGRLNVHLLSEERGPVIEAGEFNTGMVDFLVAKTCAIEKEKTEIQSRNGGAKTGAARDRSAASRAHNCGKAPEEAQAQKKPGGPAGRGIRECAI